LMQLFVSYLYTYEMYINVVTIVSAIDAYVSISRVER